jgi:phosphate uptake regulator
MFRELLNTLRQRGLMEKIEAKTRTMLHHSHEMFQASSRKLLERQKLDFDLYAMDRDINQLVVDVRKKLVEHLAISCVTGGVDAELIFFKVVVDVERIGDYSKNLLDLAKGYGKPLIDHPAFEELTQLFPIVEGFFDKTEKALFDSDQELAREVMDGHQNVNQRTEHVVEELLKNEDMSARDGIALALTARYFKRVSSHLKNVATTAVNPFHHIGYAPKDVRDKTSES